MGWDKGWKILYHGCALKNLIFSGGFIKKQYIGGNCLKRRAWTVCKFKGGLLKKRGVMFLKGGVDTPIHTMITLRQKISKNWLFL